MPADYNAILANLSKTHPHMPIAERKTMAAKIANAQRAKQGRPPAKFHRKK